MPRTMPVHPSTVLPAYADALVRSRRVAIVGDSSLGLGELFVERGARSVHVFDPDPSRTAEATARLAAAPSGNPRPQVSTFVEDLGVRQGAFDVVVIPDLSEMDGKAELLQRVKRLLPPQGLAIIAAPNPEAERWLLPPGDAVEEAPSYYELYDLVAAEFAEVKMLGQAPFVGYALVDFAAEEPDVSIDTSGLAEPEVPEWYVAIASERPIQLNEFALVEVSLADVANATAQREPQEPLTLPVAPPKQPRGVTPLGHSPERDVAIAEAQARIAVLVAENERLAAEAKRVAIEDRAREKSHDTLAMHAAELDAALTQAKARLQEMEQLAGESHARAERLGFQVRDLDGELMRERDRGGRLAKELDEEVKARSRLESEAVTMRFGADVPLAELEAARMQARDTEHKLAHEVEAHAKTREALDAALDELRKRPDPRAAEATHAREVDALEEALRERGHAVTRLTADVREAERIGRELLRENEALRANRNDRGRSENGGNGGGEPGKKARAAESAAPSIDAERAARAEADLSAASWRIAQLEREIAARSATETPPDARTRDLERALVSAQAEIAALRSAGSGPAVLPVEADVVAGPSAST
jgi:SAM-dependent methyltransferase